MDVENLLLKLLSFNTENPPGNISAMGSFIEGLLQKNGFATLRQGYGEKFNLLAWKGEPEIAILAHMDTVPSGSGWSRNPRGELVDGRIYGRGAVDVKGGMAAAISAALRAREAFLVFTFDEEVSLQGAKLLKEMDFPDKVVVTEPTSLNIGFAHRGVMEAKVKLRGKAAHASMPEKGENAIYKACELIDSLHNFEFKQDELLGRTSYSVGKIRGGEKTNIVPDYCELSIDFRTVPGDSERIVKHLRKFGEVEVIVELSPFEGSKNFAEEILRKVRAIEPGSKLVVLPYYTEAGVLSGFGKSCVVFGPGSAEQAHKKDEHIGVEELRKAEKIYLALLG